MLCFSQLFHRPHSLDLTEMRARCRRFIFCCENFRHNTQSPRSNQFLTLQAGQLSHIYHIFMFGETELGGKINQRLLRWLDGDYSEPHLAQNSEHEGRNNKINPRTLQSMGATKFQRRFFFRSHWELTVFFFVSSKRTRERERETGSNRETVYRVAIGKNITVDCGDTSVRARSCTQSPTLLAHT